MASSTKKQLKPSRKPQRAAKPPAPEDAPSPPKKPEQALQMRCRQWLEESGIWNELLIFHVPNQRKGGPGAGVFFQRMGVRAGVADWLAFPRNGKKFAIEMKSGTDQSAAQEQFQAAWERTGGTYLIAKTLDEFAVAVRAIILFHNT